MPKQDIPVYVFTGFLESGKTTFIQDSLCDKEFNTGENILVLLCEEGIEEYDPRVFPTQKVSIQTIENESDLTEDNLIAFEKKYKPKHILIEYNGMWAIQNLYNAMPENWFIFRQMCFADATKFITYNANMRQQTVDKLSTSQMLIFNRASEKTDTDEFHKIIRSISRQIAIAYIYADGKVWYDETEDPLPFDIDAPIIEIEDRDYALWYRDISEEMEKYDGKTVKFKGMVFNETRGGKDIFCMGRHVMVCCTNDITYRAFVCKYAIKPSFKTNDWATITARITIEKHQMYKGKGPILNILSIGSAECPDEQVATFY